jgi:hypothetical protein
MGYRGFYVDPQRFELRSIATFESARDQSPTLASAGTASGYLQNFFFVPYTDVHDFTARATAFLDAERRLARPPQPRGNF